MRVTVIAKINHHIACRSRYRAAKRHGVIATAQHQIDIFSRKRARIGQRIISATRQQPEIATAGETASQGDRIGLTGAGGDANIA